MEVFPDRSCRSFGAIIMIRGNGDYGSFDLSDKLMPRTLFCITWFHDLIADGRIDFATFVAILDKHSKTERCQQDIIDAFKAHDRKGDGTVPASELQHILTQFGEKMNQADGKKNFHMTSLILYYISIVLYCFYPKQCHVKCYFYFCIS